MNKKNCIRIIFPVIAFCLPMLTILVCALCCQDSDLMKYASPVAYIEGWAMLAEALPVLNPVLLPAEIMLMLWLVWPNKVTGALLALAFHVPTPLTIYFIVRLL